MLPVCCVRFVVELWTSRSTHYIIIYTHPYNNQQQQHLPFRQKIIILFSIQIVPNMCGSTIRSMLHYTPVFGLNPRSTIQTNRTKIKLTKCCTNLQSKLIVTRFRLHSRTQTHYTSYLTDDSQQWTEQVQWCLSYLQVFTVIHFVWIIRASPTNFKPVYYS